MKKKTTHFLSQIKRSLFPATIVILMLSVFLQTIVIARSNSTPNSDSSKAKLKNTGTSSVAGPVVAPPVKIVNHKQSLMVDCSSQTALRQEISKRWRFFTQPVPPFLPGIGIPGLNRKARKNYEELYWSARALEEIGKQLLREARKEVDKNLLTSACSILDQEFQTQIEIANTDADAINLWNNSLTNTYNRIKKIRDYLIIALQVGGVVASGGIPLLVLGILNSLLKEMTDNALFQANLPPETYARIIIFDVLIPILLEIKVAKWGNRTFSEYVTKKLTIPMLVKNPPGFVKLVKEAFRVFRGELRTSLESKIIARLGGIITRAQITILVEGINHRLEQYMNESTNAQRSDTDFRQDDAYNTDSSFLTLLEITPAAAATEVNITVPTVSVRFSESIQAVNLQAQLLHQDGSSVPLNSGIIGDTLFFNLGSALQPNTSFTMRLLAGSVRGTESNALNQDLEWSFVTDTASLANGSSALVTNTGGVGLRLRNSPGTSAGIITTLSEGTRLTVTGNSVQSDGYTWYPVQTQNGQTGWSATGNWLTAIDQYGFRPGGEVQVSNTSGVGLRLRVDAGEASPIITVLSEGTIVKLTGEPVFVDGYSWFPVQTSNGTQGYCAVARWLIPYSQSGASNLVIRTVAVSSTTKLDWGQSTTYDFYVTDGNGLPVSGAAVSGQNNLIGNIFSTPNTTDANGRTSYTTTVPTGLANGAYSIVASATRSGFSNSLSVTRNVEVSHGCSYEVHATDSTFSSSGGSGSLSIITQPGCGWSVPQYPGFVSLTSSDHGIGDGEVTFNVAANSSSSSRTGNMIAAGATILISQDGAPANGLISVGTDPDGLSFTIDGQTYSSRQNFAWANGSTHTVSTSSPQTIGVNTFNFTGWSDAGAQTHTVTATANQSLTAHFELPSSTNVALDYSWQTRSISIVHGWGAAAVAPGDGFLYVLGGSVNSAKFSRFDPASNTWTQLPNIPGEGTIEGAAAMLDGKIYVYGNYSTTIMRVYDMASGQWLSNRTGPYPIPVRGSSFIVTGGELYSVGGADISLNPVSGLKKYNPGNDTWTQLADMPTPRSAGATTLADGRIYVAGGNASGNGITSVNIYDPQSNTWSVGTPLPQTRILATAIAINSRILVIGGSNGTVETRTVLEYNPVSNVWRELSQFNQGRYGAVGAFMRGKLYVIGGEDATNHTAFATLEEGTPSAWAPTLSFGQPFGAISGNRLGFVNLSISNPSNNYAPITLISSDPSKISFPFTYTLSPGQTSTQITFRTGYAGGPVTIIAELPDDLARVRGYTQITVAPGTASAETQGATDITSDSASLNGTVNPSGSQTNVYFEFGTDPNLNNPQTTTQVNAGEGLTSVTTTFPVGGLQSGATYYYQVVASNGAGITKGSILSFATTSHFPPNNPTSVNQFRIFANETLPEGGSTKESAVRFRATVSDPDGDPVKLQIELRQSSEPFTGIPTNESSLVSSGSQATITRLGLALGNYKWAYRAMDSSGLASAWTEFGSAGNTDFSRVNILNDYVRIDQIYRHEEGGIPYIYVRWTLLKKWNDAAVAVYPSLNDNLPSITLGSYFEPLFMGDNYIAYDSFRSLGIGLDQGHYMWKIVGSPCNNAEPGPGTYRVGDQYATRFSKIFDMSTFLWVDAANVTSTADIRFTVYDRTQYDASPCNMDFREAFPDSTDYHIDDSHLNFPPNNPTSVNQFRIFANEALPEGGSTKESAVRFRATVSDPDGDPVKLQIELRQSSEPFNGTPTNESALASSGSYVTITQPGITFSNYKWAYRAMDANGLASPWIEYGVAGNTDFSRVHVDNDYVRIDQIYRHEEGGTPYIYVRWTLLRKWNNDAAVAVYPSLNNNLPSIALGSYFEPLFMGNNYIVYDSFRSLGISLDQGHYMWKQVGGPCNNAGPGPGDYTVGSQYITRFPRVFDMLTYAWTDAANVTSTADIRFTIYDRTQYDASPCNMDFKEAFPDSTDYHALTGMTINDVSKVEGDSGASNVTFTVTLSNPSSQTVTAQFTTINGTSSAGSDYVSTNGTITFNPNQITRTITVAVGGDILDEANESFSVVLSSPSGAIIDDNTGVCTIIDDDTNSGDFDGDGKNDLSVFRPNADNTHTAKWYVLNSVDGTVIEQYFGAETDIPVAGDYDGDGKKEIAVWRPLEGAWYISRGSAQNFVRIQWGQNSDLPVPADYDGDGKTDVAVFRPSDGYWYVLKSSDGQWLAAQWGLSTDKPVPSDYDGDGKADLAVFRKDDPAVGSGRWYILRSSGGSFIGAQWGASDDKLVPADYDLDGKTDLAVWRPSNGTFYVLRSSDGAFQAAQWGLLGDVPVVGDYDNDGKADYAVWRPSSGKFYVRQSSDGNYIGPQWGQSGDVPVASRYIPQQ